jgi:hypothetical protein
MDSETKAGLSVILGTFLAVILLSWVVQGNDCWMFKIFAPKYEQQEILLKEAAAQTGMPAIANFRERKLLKDIIELRDQNGLVTYTYVWNEFNGKMVFFCDSIGYGIPYATQYTSPEKMVGYNSAPAVVPQADPNGLFSPASAEGTWVMCKNPNGKEVRPVYVEPRIIVSPFPLTKQPAEQN